MVFQFPRGLDQEKNQNLDPHRNLHLYHGEEEEEEEEEDDPERVSLRNPATASFQELFNQNQLLYARRLGQSPDKRPYFPSPLSGEPASPREKTRENPPPPPSRLGRRSSVAAAGGGEIVEVQGGHIVRATGRKDRHSKVCTAKGPRDRRVRLAAHTAIQFYDVQDRLGYDRPSKAVDWLIKKAKAAIDELAELPAWHPTAAASESAQKKKETDGQSSAHHAMLGEQMPSFLPPSLDSDAIADTIKSFFPTGSAGEPSSSAVEFHNFSAAAAAHSNTQDLRLSLQSFQDPILLHHHHHHYTPPPPPPPQANPSHSDQARAPQGQQNQQHVLLSGTPLGFDGWPPPPPWNSGGDPASSAEASFQFNSPPPAQLFGGGQFFTSQQRGPLQSSNTPSLRAWMDPSAAITISMADHGQHHHHPGSLPVYPSSAFGYSGFHIPARIQGEEEEHDGYSDKPSSASSDSRH